MFDRKAYTEKALNKMIKAKAKAERAAAHQAAAAQAASDSTSRPAAVGTPGSVPAEESQPPEAMVVDTRC